MSWDSYERASQVPGVVPVCAGVVLRVDNRLVVWGRRSISV